MANTQLDGAREMMTMAIDQPLTAEENLVFEYAKRRTTYGYFDDVGRYYRPSGSGSGARAQPETAPSSSAAPSAPTGAGITTAGSGFVAPQLTLTRVQPGDLITAGFVNGLIDTLLILDDRMRDLEANSGRVVSPTPPVIPTTPATPASPVTPVNPRTALNIAKATASAVTGQKSVTIVVTGNGLAPKGLRSVRIGSLDVDMSLVRGTDTKLNIVVSTVDAKRIGKTPVLTIVNDDGESESEPITVSRGSNNILENLR